MTWRLALLGVVSLVALAAAMSVVVEVAANSAASTVAAVSLNSAAPETFAPVTPPTAVVDGAGSLYLHDGAPVLVADSALPLRLYVERPIVDRYGLGPIIAAARAWTVAGSYLTINVHEAHRRTTRQPQRDGSSRIFADPNCDRGTLAYTTPHTDRLVVRDRPVAVASEVDIGVCDAAPDGHEAATAMFLHELGHAFGLAHQCPYPKDCWQPGMATTITTTGRGGCRTMTADTACARPTDISVLDAHAIVRAYPLLRRLGGADPADTAAWVTWHLYPHPVDGIVVLAADASHQQQLQATVQAASRGWPLLIAAADNGTCHQPFTAELRRLSGPHTSRYTYGNTPAGCRTQLRSLPEAAAPTRQSDHLVLLPTDAAHADGWFAAYAAARLHARLITTDTGPVPEDLLSDAATIILVANSGSPPPGLTERLAASAQKLVYVRRPDDLDRLTGTDATRGVVVARMSTDGPAAVTLAIGDGRRPVAVDRGLTWQLRPHLVNRDGYIVGGPDQLPDAAQSWLSQLAAGTEAPRLPAGW